MKIKPTLTLEPQLKGELALAHELEDKVREDIRDHWNKKILNRIVPTEVKGRVSKAEHTRALEKLAFDQTVILKKLFKKEWRPKPNQPVFELHYFGIGMGEVLKHLIPTANKANHVVIAYDTSDSGVSFGKREIDTAVTFLPNAVYLADIEDACDERYLPPNTARKLIVARVLDVLDKQEKGSENKPYEERKMARTARKIGALMHYLEVFLLHPCPEDNPKAIWGDTTPHPLSDVIRFMQEGASVPLEKVELGKIDFYGHIYTALLIKGRSI